MQHLQCSTIQPIGKIPVSRRWRNDVNRACGLVAALLALVLSADSGRAQTSKTGVEKLYVLNCGEGVAGDISRWSPGVNEGKSMDFVDNCYLIKHAQGWFLWDTGISDAVAAMPNGLAPSDPKAVTAPDIPVSHRNQPCACLIR